ncbi:MAG: DNA-3-methyladenine glycosylase 2 family protein [Acidimicrobiia bacterium]|nr:DNA-3-methyladenine glycosylase 2 family protein [Acidimicrobiia bacterium]
MEIVSWNPPASLDLAVSMARFARWGGDPVNRFDGVHYWRAFRHDSQLMAYRARQESRTIVIETDGEPSIALADLEYRLGGTLPFAPLEDLCSSDLVISRERDARPGYRPPLEPDLLASLVTSITAQQVNLTWATTTRTRLVERYGAAHSFLGETLWCFPQPEVLAAADTSDLRAMQFTTRKSEFIVEVGRQVASGGLDDLERLSDEDVVDSLVAIRGVGRWTAEWTLARHLGRPNAVAAGDLGVRKAISHLYLGSEHLLPDEEVRKVVAPWGDAANWATHLFLEALSTN